MELAAAHIVPGNTLTAATAPRQQQPQHDLRRWCGEIGTSAWDSSTAANQKGHAFCQAMWMSVHIHHEANFSTMSWCHLSHWFANYVSGVLHSPFQVLFSLSHLGLASFLGRWNWRGTSWSTGRLGGRGATGGCNSTEHLGYSLVMSGILWHVTLILWCIYIIMYIYIHMVYTMVYHGISWYIPVVPHKAVAEVSKIGNL